jgi:hypothetical protein
LWFHSPPDGPPGSSGTTTIVPNSDPPRSAISHLKTVVLVAEDGFEPPTHGL